MKRDICVFISKLNVRRPVRLYFSLFSRFSRLGVPPTGTRMKTVLHTEVDVGGKGASDLSYAMATHCILCMILVKSVFAIKMASRKFM